ncbi:murein DD-endopeptidase MepM/ murein hydrolase activator NlpD [Agromyces sp. 3263]|uniref:M23 family metallopeptidase n=1 Tax=Agromyces sp. 3263 TaxID=2817750 RepID=UPI00285847F6|nr:peptidoglycan DD-metalloendopeptidase family protein [Agromyces sp. 3263]MDR6905383.1 murein DD-endopeptidase MepM/ murein hydrolase activator NlpD [Agromyces sp. 3263]
MAPVAASDAVAAAAPHPVAPQAERPGFDAIFGLSDAATTPAALPAVAQPGPTPRRSAPTIDIRTTEAEQADRPGGPSSASAVPGADTDRARSRRGGAGFDDLFAGLGDEEAGASDEASDGGRSRRAASSPRESRTDRKSAKAAKSGKAAKGKSVKAARRSSAEPPMPVGPRRTGSTPAPTEPIDGDLAFLIAGGAASTAAAVRPGFPAGDAAALGAGSGAVAGAASSFAAAISAAAGARPADEPGRAAASVAPAPLAFDLSAPSAATPSSRRASRGLPAEVTPASDLLGFAPSAPPRVDADAASAPDRSAPGTSPASTGPVSRRDVVRAAAPTRRSAPQASGHPTARAAASAPKRRGGRRIASVVAMSFVAMLAVATTIPSLSLLSPADVQAMAMASATGGDRGGQSVTIDGNVVAQTVEREGYEHQTIQEYAQAAGIRAEADFTNNPAGTIQWPFAVGVHIGDHFGYRNCAGCSEDHGGQDFNPGYGAEIQAIADGTVAVSTDSGGSLGVVMMIDHIIDGELVTSVYAHMIEGSRRFEVGDTVHVADVIGKTGNTGMSTGPHLHFEIRLGGVDGTKVDPLEWLYANTN